MQAASPRRAERAAFTAPILSIAAAVAVLAGCASPSSEWSSRVKAAPTEINARLAYDEETVRQSYCDNECKLSHYPSMALRYESTQQREKARQTYEKLMAECRSASSDTLKIYGGQCKASKDRFERYATTGNSERVVTIEDMRADYRKSPTPFYAKDYLKELAKRNLMDEYYREKSYQERIGEPLANAEAEAGKPTQQLDQSDMGVVNAAVATMLGEKARLHQLALQETKKTGLTQHDGYLQRMASDYSRMASESLTRGTGAESATAQKSNSGTFLGMDMNTVAGIGAALGMGNRQGVTGALQTFSNAMTAQAMASDPNHPAAAVASAASSGGSSPWSNPAVTAATPGFGQSASAPGPGGAAMAGVGAAGVAGTSGSAGNCRTDLRHAEHQLPRYNNDRLTQLRTQLLTARFTDEFKKSVASGMTPAQAAGASAQAAQRADQRRETAKQCIHQVSTNPAAVIASLENGSYSFDKGSIMDECASVYVAQYYGAVFMRENAVATACMAQQ